METLYKRQKLPLFCQSKLFNIKLTLAVSGMMDVLYVYCFKSVGSYKHKLSRIESLVILYWGINCIPVACLIALLTVYQDQINKQANSPFPILCHSFIQSFLQLE